METESSAFPDQTVTPCILAPWRLDDGRSSGQSASSVIKRTSSEDIFVRSQDTFDPPIASEPLLISQLGVGVDVCVDVDVGV